MGRFAGIAGALRVMSSETWKQAFGKLVFIFIHMQIEILISHNFSCPQPFFLYPYPYKSFLDSYKI